MDLAAVKMAQKSPFARFWDIVTIAALLLAIAIFVRALFRRQPPAPPSNR